MNDSGYESVADFGVLYDAVPAYAARPDLGFYLDQATRAGDGAGAATVLELGCGTGRVLLPLAREGHPITGLDRSAAMLARCRARLAEESDAVRTRVTLHQGDVRDFTIAPPTREGFALAIAPFRVLQHLTTISDQLDCLAAIRRHLAPGGLLAFDVFNPHYPLMATDRSAEVEDTAELQLPDGRLLRRTARITRIRWVDQVSEVELIYYLRSGEDIQRIVQAFPMRWYTRVELEHLLARAGFEPQAVYGDFDRGDLADDSPEMVVVARCG